MKRLWNAACTIPGIALMSIAAIAIWTDNIRTLPYFQTPPPVVVDTLVPPEQELKELGRRIKAAYPGAYDDLTDEDLGRRVKAKFPGVFDKLADTKPIDRKP